MLQLNLLFGVGTFLVVCEFYVGGLNGQGLIHYCFATLQVPIGRYRVCWRNHPGG